MNLVWRFFRGNDSRWHWEQLSMNKDVLASSRGGHSEYEKCLLDAQTHGYSLSNSGMPIGEVSAPPRGVRQYFRYR